MNLHGPRPRVPRIRVRLATLADLDLLVRHRRRMWEAISDILGGSPGRRGSRVPPLGAGAHEDRFAWSGSSSRTTASRWRAGAFGPCPSSRGRTGKARRPRICSRSSRNRVIEARAMRPASRVPRSGGRDREVSTRCSSTRPDMASRSTAAWGSSRRRKCDSGSCDRPPPRDGGAPRGRAAATGDPLRMRTQAFIYDLDL